MSDDLSTVGTVEVPAEVAGAPAKTGFLSTPTGRIVAIVVGLGALAIIAGIAVAIVMVVFGGQAVDSLEQQLQEQTTGAPAASVTSTTTAVVASGPADKVANSEIFTFRDIFVPLLKEIPESSTGGTTPPPSTGPTDTVTPPSSNALTFQNVVTEGGVMKAVLVYNGKTYTLGPGEAIPNSPWQVLRVSSTTVTMLYGSETVSLGLGSTRVK